MFDGFLKWYEARTLRAGNGTPAPQTLANKRMKLQGVARMMGTTDECSLGTLLGDRAAVDRILDHLYAKHAPATVSMDVSALVQFGRYAEAQGWITRCLITADDKPKNIPQKPIEVYTQHEIDRLLLFAEARGSLRFWMLLATVVHTGRRISEILNLTWADLRLEGEQPHFDLPTTKTKRQQYVPLDAALRTQVWTPENVEALRVAPSACRNRTPVSHPFPMDYCSAQVSLRSLCKAARIPHKGFHAFRHTKATQLLERGVPIQAVSMLLGHSSVATTDKVYHHATALSYASYLD